VARRRSGKGFNAKDRVIFPALIVQLVLIAALLVQVNDLRSSVESLTSKDLQQAKPSQKANNPPVGGEGKVEVSADDDPFLGSKDAKVTIVEFSDFQCPFCARFHSQTFPQLKKEYIDTGKVRYVYRDFPLSFHQHAMNAAIAAECADEQGKFWEYHDKLFQNQRALDDSSLKRYAEEIGLDTSKFNSCLDNKETASEVNKDVQDGQRYGVSGTPTFFINGVKLVGAQPYSAFKQVVDQQLG